MHAGYVGNLFMAVLLAGTGGGFFEDEAGARQGHCQR